MERQHSAARQLQRVSRGALARRRSQGLKMGASDEWSRTDVSDGSVSGGSLTGTMTHVSERCVGTMQCASRVVGEFNIPPHMSIRLQSRCHSVSLTTQSRPLWHSLPNRKPARGPHGEIGSLRRIVEQATPPPSEDIFGGFFAFMNWRKDGSNNQPQQQGSTQGGAASLRISEGSMPPSSSVLPFCTPSGGSTKPPSPSVLPFCTPTKHVLFGQTLDGQV